MATPLRRVYLADVLLIIIYVIQNSVTETSDGGITSTDSVSYSKDDETWSSQTISELPDTRTDKFMETLLYDDTSPVYEEIKIINDNSYNYLWDKTELSSREYQERFCPYRCKDGKWQELIQSNGYCADVFCFPCSCQKPECQIYGICCPDISVPYLSPPDKGMYSASETGQTSHVRDQNADVFHGNNSNPVGSIAAHHSLASEAKNEQTRNLPENVNSEYVNSAEIKAQPKLGCYTQMSENVLYIRSCHAGIKVSSEVLQKCESNIPEDEVGFDTVALVTDNQTIVVYYNEYCAECNGVKQQLKWRIEVSCRTFMRVYTARSQDEFLRQALDTRPYCSVQQIGHEELRTESCVVEWFGAAVTDACNMTGLWGEFDEDVVTACSSLTSHAYMGMSKWSVHVYKNIFCAICNQENSTRFSKCTHHEILPPLPIVYSPYSILFNLGDKPFDTDGSGREAACNASQWPAPDGSCIPVHCSPGKNLVDGNCSTAVTQISGLGYRLQLWFFPEVDNITETRFAIDVPLSQYSLDMFYASLFALMAPLAYADLSYGVLLNTSTTEAYLETYDESPKSTSPDCSDVITASTTTEEVDDCHFRVPYLYWVTGNIIPNRSIFRDMAEQTMLDELFSKTFRVNYNDRVSVNFRPVLMWHDFDISTYCSNIEKDGTRIKCFHGQLYRTNGRYKLQFYNVFDLFLNFTKTLTCKYVSFQRSQYLIETTYKDLLPVVTVKLNFSSTQLTITNDSDLSKMSVDASGVLNVCCDVLDQQIALLSGVGKEPGLMQNIQYVLSLVCMGVSIGCLLLTVMTYARFSVLRSVAGRNTLCLCLSLLLAQASLLASFFTDVKSALCLPLGMLTHFCWLSLFSWNFICCFYMYNVFSKIRNLQVNPRSQNLTLVKNLAFTLLTPAIIVSAVVVGAYVTSGGSSLGYGGSVCYLNDRILVGVATIGPVVLITITNIIFFLMTVYNIHGVGRLQKCETSKKDDRNNLYIYVKLSSMTGAFWVTFIVAEVSDLDGLRILAIILNGLQGLFIFMSYICNKRVLMLYLPHLIRDTTLTMRTRDSTTSVPNARRVTETHELQATQSMSSVCSDAADGSSCPTDSILVRLDSSLDQAADGIVPQK